MSEIIVDVKTGLKIRKDTYDKNIIAEVSKSYILDVEGKIVFDIGGCFGAYSNLALRKGAKHVICFEPDPDNCELIKQNCSEFTNFTLIEAALISGNSNKINFYKSTTGKNCGNYSTTEFRGREKVTVEAVNFKDQLEIFKPEILKVDCEGSEYDLFGRTEIPEFVNGVMMEIHLSKPEWRRVWAPQLINIFDDWGCVTKPKITDKNWFTLGVWKR